MDAPSFDVNAPGVTEDALVEALFAGSRQAAEALVESTYRVVFASLMKLSGGDAALSADLTQETYRKAWSSLRAFQRRARFSTWLYRIAYNSFLNHRRARGRTTSLEDLPALDPIDSGPTPEQEVSAREVRERLRRAVLDLPEDLRFTVTARFWGEVPVPEIARSEGVSEVAIRKRLRRAFAAIRESLNEENS